MTEDHKTFKVKCNGQTLTARVMGRDEKITERTLQCLPFDWEDPKDLKSLRWKPSHGVGDSISDYNPKRIYIEVTSHFYKGESTCQSWAKTELLK